MRALAILLVFGAGCVTTQVAADPPLPEPAPSDLAALRADLAEMFVERGAFDAALPLLGEALRAAPKNPRVHVLLGVVLRDRGVRDQAEIELKRALELAPGYAPALSALGVLYDQQHRFAEAQGAHRRAVAAARDCVKCWNNL